jgi:hypothetical protein
MPAELEIRMWKQLKGAFAIKRIVMVPKLDVPCPFDQYDSMEEALETCEGELVFLEPGGFNSITEIPVGEIVLVLGNTQMGNMKLTSAAESYAISTPRPTDLYGINAAAIALSHWVHQ